MESIHRSRRLLGYTVESNTEGDAARQDALRRMYEHKVENHNFDRCHRYLGDYFIRESVIPPLKKPASAGFFTTARFASEKISAEFLYAASIADSWHLRTHYVVFKKMYPTRDGM
jgi:hypothetical protein